MKKLILLPFIVLLLLVTATAAENYSVLSINENEQVYRDYRSFLIRLGFKDYCKKMEESLASGQTTDISEKVLEDNLEHYQIVNIAREIAAFTFSYSKNFSSDKNLNRLTILSSFLLSPDKEFSSEAIEKYSKTANVDLDASYGILVKKKMIDEKKIILASIIELAAIKDTKAIATLDEYLTRYLIIKYTTRTSFKQTSYLGRAMVASYVRYLRLNDMKDVERELSKTLEKRNIFLSNFVSNQITFIDKKQNKQSATVYSGDFATEYSKGAEAYYISIGTAPKGVKNSIKAMSDNLLGNAFKIAVYPSSEQEETILAKVEKGEALTAMEKVKYKLLKSNTAVAGYSHAALVDVKTDRESGIKMPWIWDIYPNGSVGGIRFLGAEGYVFPGEFQKIGFIHYDPLKFLRYYKSQIASRGYLKTVWESYTPSIDENDFIEADHKADRYSWPSRIDEETVMSFMNVEEKDADIWFQNEIAKRVTSMFEEYFTGPDALAFANMFINVRGAAYCSQAIVLAYLQGANIDPETSPDRFTTVVKIGKAAKIPDLVDVDMSERIISPSGFGWQMDLVKTHSSIMISQDLEEKNSNLDKSFISNSIDNSFMQILNNVELNTFSEIKIKR